MSKAQKKRPYLKFFGTDWRGDAGLRAVSFAARGLWIDMLTLMHEAEDYGHLVINGKAPDAKRLALILGGSEKDVARLIKELEDEGIFSRRADGVIYSRRMRADHEKELADIENGKAGGNPSLPRKPPKEDKVGVNPQVPAVVNGADKANAGDPLPLPLPVKPGSAFGGLEHVVTEEDTGRPLVNGWYLDRTWERVAEAARIDNARWTGNYKPLIGWLADGIEPDTIVGVIAKRAEQSGYNVPQSLGYFDKPVREAHGRKAA